MLKMKVKRINPDAKLPQYSREGDAGMDIFSCEDYKLAPGEKYNFKTGFASEFAPDYFAKIYDRSSMANISQIINLGGVIDSNYRGEWNVTLKNIGDTPYKIEKGSKIAQVVFHKISKVKVEETDNLSDSSRGDGWAGSSGRF